MIHVYDTGTKIHVAHFTSNRVQETGAGYPIHTTKLGGYPDIRILDQFTSRAATGPLVPTGYPGTREKSRVPESRATTRGLAGSNFKKKKIRTTTLYSRQ